MLDQLRTPAEEQVRLTQRGRKRQTQLPFDSICLCLSSLTPSSPVKGVYHPAAKARMKSHASDRFDTPSPTAPAASKSLTMR